MNSDVNGMWLFNILGNKLIFTLIFHLNEQVRNSASDILKRSPTPDWTWVPRLYTVTGCGGLVFSYLFTPPTIKVPTVPDPMAL